MKIENLKVYELEESIIASAYHMLTDLSNNQVGYKDIKRVLKLTELSNGNGAHGQWLTGVRVNFDLTCTNKMWVEAERYRFFEFVSSQSTMHRISKFNLSKTYNEYVDPRIIDIMQEKVEDYNNFINEINSNLVPQNEEWMKEQEELKNIKYLELLYSNPSGFELTARIATNYRCLLNMYVQRANHRLPEWREFCDYMYHNLPLFNKIVEAYQQEIDYDEIEDIYRGLCFDKDCPIPGQIRMDI